MLYNMLRIKIVAVGGLKESFWKSAIDEYIKRLGRFVKVEIREVSEFQSSSKTTPDKIREMESKNIESALDGFVVALDKEGENFSSEDFAKFFELKKIEGVSKICFVIGGSYGFDESIRSRANLILSFGKNTYPHQLMRVVLLEQIYRAMTIINKIEYHK